MVSKLRIIWLLEQRRQSRGAATARSAGEGRDGAAVRAAAAGVTNLAAAQNKMATLARRLSLSLARHWAISSMDEGSVAAAPAERPYGCVYVSSVMRASQMQVNLSHAWFLNYGLYGTQTVQRRRRRDDMI